MPTPMSPRNSTPTCTAAVIARIDRILAGKRPAPAKGYPRPVHDRKAKHQRPPTWHYSFGLGIR